MSPLRFVVAVCFAASGSFASAGSPVDTSSPLEEVSTEFQMCDGPAWDGNTALYVPDVKGGKLYRYRPAQKKLEVVLADAGRISASCFNHGKLYLSDNGESRLALLRDGKKVPLEPGHDKNAKPPIKPNDLVVDIHGGIYYTLTGQGQVMYRTPEGKLLTAVDKIDTPNGLALSPDEQTLYVASYAPKKIWAYDVTAPGTTAAGREFAAMDDGPEKGADGMTIDRAGNVYCAGFADVWIWSPGGKLLDKIKTPTRPINCEFGDGDLHSLYITCFGGLYKQRMHVTGRPPEPPATSQDQRAGERLSTVLPANVTPHIDVVYAQYGDRKLLADLFVPSDKPGPLPAVVVVHGGGWQNGDKVKFRTMAQTLAARGYTTMAIEYRLSEDAKFPAAIHDCNAAVRFLRANAAKYKVDPTRIGAVGGSAGAHLVGLMAAAPHVKELQGDGGHADQSSAIQAAVLMAGPMELAAGNVAESSRKQKNFFSNIFLGKTVDEDPELYKRASPITYFSKQTPPMLFSTGALDRPERDAAAIAKLKELSVWTDQKIYADGKHGCWNQPGWFPAMVDDVDTFFQAHLK